MGPEHLIEALIKSYLYISLVAGRHNNTINIFCHSTRVTQGGGLERVM